MRLAAGTRGAAGAAEQDFRQALAAADAQGARRLGLRAATSMARLKGSGGDHRRQSLTRTIQGITEAIDLPDMHEARDLLRRGEQ